MRLQAGWRLASCKMSFCTRLPRRIESLKGVLQQATGMMRCYPVFAELGQDSGNTLPSRDMFKMLYGTLQKEKSLQLQDTE